MKPLLLLVVLFANSAFGQDSQGWATWEQFAERFCQTVQSCKVGDSYLEYYGEVFVDANSSATDKTASSIDEFSGELEEVAKLSHEPLILTREEFDFVTSKLKEAAPSTEKSITDLSTKEFKEIELRLGQAGEAGCEVTAIVCGHYMLAAPGWLLKGGFAVCVGSSFLCKNYYKKVAERAELELKVIDQKIKDDADKADKKAKEDAAKKEAEKKEAEKLEPGSGEGTTTGGATNEDGSVKTGSGTVAQLCRSRDGGVVVITEGDLKKVIPKPDIVVCKEIEL